MIKTSKTQNGFFQYLIVLTAACMVFAVMQGVRDNYGIMMTGITAHSGLSYQTVSFVIAVGQILYGATQPFFGMLALRKSNTFVMLCGIALMTAGLIATPFCAAGWQLLIFFGILLPSGTGALCFGIIMGAITPIIGERRAAIASGIVQASAGIGDSLMSPGIQGMIAWKGILTTMPCLSLPILLMTPVVFWIGYKNKRLLPTEHTVEKTDRKQERLGVILRTGMKNPAYWCLLIGFSTCGFHMAIIETHLYSQYVAAGISGSTASLTLTVYGIATMLGAMLTGFLGLKFKMKNVLSFVYGTRVLIAAGFILLPKTVPFAFAATAFLGLTGDSTVPPTTGIITKKWGSEKMAILYGSIFIGHQIGAFCSSSLGGILVNTPMGYTALWIVDLTLSLLASAASFQIKE